MISLAGAIPILLGSDIGTCITGVLDALGSSISAKRVSVAHVLFNVIGTILFMCFLSPFADFVGWLDGLLNLSPEMTIAFVHGIFNLTVTIVLLHFIDVLAFLVIKLILGQDQEFHYKPLYLDYQLMRQSSAIALGNAKKELIHLGAYAIQSIEAAYAYVAGNQAEYAEKVDQFEQVVNSIDEALTKYLIELSHEPLSDAENEMLISLLDLSRDWERNSAHVVSLIQLTDYNMSKDIVFSDTAKKELEKLYENPHRILLDTIQLLTDTANASSSAIQEQHQLIKQLERTIRRSHVE